MKVNLLAFLLFYQSFQLIDCLDKKQWFQYKVFKQDKVENTKTPINQLYDEKYKLLQVEEELRSLTDMTENDISPGQLILDDCMDVESLSSPAEILSLLLYLGFVYHSTTTQQTATRKGKGKTKGQSQRQRQRKMSTAMLVASFLFNFFRNIKPSN
jgi:hypothetical protein